MTIVCSLGTDIGRVLSQNQDSLLLKKGKAQGIEYGLFAVADGMGGMAEGQRASRIAVETLENWWNENHTDLALNPGMSELCMNLKSQFIRTNERLRQFGRSKDCKVGTTLSTLLIVGNQFALCHIGDSRVYLLRRSTGKLQQLTTDHTYVAEQVKLGRLSVAMAECHPHKNLLTRCLGVMRHVEVCRLIGRFEPGDVFILCSDGLYNKVPDRELERYILAGLGKNINPARLTHKLISTANKNGGNDNISVIVAWVANNVWGSRLRKLGNVFSLK